MKMFSAVRVIVVTVIAAWFSGVLVGQQLGRDDHRMLHWSGAGGCIAGFSGTPCRTVRYHIYSFGQSLGFDGTTRSEWVEAFDQTGSEAKTVARTFRRWWPLPQETTNKSELLLRTQDQLVYIDHGRKVYEAHQGAKNRPSPNWEEDDDQCSHTATHSAYLTGRLPDSVIAGVHVVGYRGRDFRGADYEVYFAPSIGCQDMQFRMVMRGFLGWITAEFDMAVDSYILGPPAQSLFTIPSDYRLVPSILQFQSAH